MTIEYKYIALDGTEFSNEQDCIKYEFDIMLGFNSVIMYDADTGIQTIEEGESFTEFVKRAFGSAGFIYIIDPKEAKPFLEWIEDYYGYETSGLTPKNANPNTAYYYNEYREKWQSFESYFDYGEVLKFIKKTIEKEVSKE